MIAMKTMYVVLPTDPAVDRFALSPRLMAPPTIGPDAFAVCQIAR